MSTHAALEAVSQGVIIGACIIGTYTAAEIIALVLGRKQSLAQSLADAWNTRPWRAPRERRTRTQGPGS